MRICASVLLLLAAAGPAAAQQEPAADEMAFLWALNRARSNPPQYAAENGLGSLLDAVLPAPPLALNPNLVQSARFKAVEMATNDYFAHQSAVTSTWPNKLERDNGYALHSSLSDTANNVESLAAGTVLTALGALKLLVEDTGVVPPGHRYHLLADGPNRSFYLLFREAGFGHGFDATSTYENYYAFHTGYRDADSAWLTGVVYSDANSNGRYDQGEGLGGVTVTVAGGGSAVTGAAGGWSIATTAGTWTVTCSGGAFSGTSTATPVVAGDNVEVDFESGTAAGIVGFNAAPPPGGGGGGGGSSGGGGGGCSPGGSSGGLLPVFAALGLLALLRRR